MSLHRWLQNIRSALTPGRDRPGRRGSQRVATHRPNLEGLEDRLTPSLSWYLDYPAGEFFEVVPDGFNYTSQTSLAADFNGDGQFDVFRVQRAAAASDFTDFGTVELNCGDGTFDVVQSFQVGYPIWIGAGDFNSDGRPDVVVYNNDSNWLVDTVSVYLNDGNWEGPPPPPIVPSIAVSDTATAEDNAGAVSATFTVTLSAESAEPVTVAYATASGTATAGSDYQAASGTLTFAPGETSKTVIVLVSGDRLGEPNETFFLNLSNSSNATVTDGQGIGTILDDEPRISISDVTRYEGKKGRTTLFTFTVTLSAAYDQPVTMSFQTANGTATTSNNDYVAKSGTLTFAPGETTKTITIEVKGDSKREASETFYLDLFGLSSNALFTKNRGLGTILNDD